MNEAGRSAGRWVVLGLARHRAEWFRSMSQWATSATLPLEFVKCLSIEELSVRLTGARTFSAVLVDGSAIGVDRTIVQTARDAGCAVLVVEDHPSRRDWLALGASAVLASTFSPAVLLEALAGSASMVGRAAVGVGEPAEDEPESPPGRGAVAVVCGPGGTGASTVAAALAEGLGRRPETGSVVLADLALRSEQAMLHDVRDVVPGIQELVEAHRHRSLGPDGVRAHTFLVVERHYHLLLGLRRARHWTALRPHALAAAFDALRRSFATVVCDVTADFEGEDDAGSVDVGERNAMARTAVADADVVFAVGRPGVKGVHALVRVLCDLADASVPPGRIVPVVNLAPRSPRARAGLVATLAELAAPALAGGSTAPPIFLPTRQVEDALRDAVGMPSPLPGVVSGAFVAVRRRLGPPSEPPPDPGCERVAPGSLGRWSV